ncbi:MAG: hypothetical protein HKN07_13670 [Acidimicrobiia bacterium]|nr:hypothetical protein [Acidimicrobiia bacterium]
MAKPKSRNRPLFMMVAGLILAFTAADVLWLNILSQPPKVDDTGNLTTRGRKELVLDRVWGILLLTGGIGLMFGAFAIKPSPYAGVTSRGLLLRVGKPGEDQVLVPWEHIEDLSAADVEDELGLSPTLVVEVSEKGDIPAVPWRSQWHTPKRLLVDATGWDVDPSAIATAAIPHLEAARIEAAEIPHWSEGILDGGGNPGGAPSGPDENDVDV